MFRANKKSFRVVFIILGFFCLIASGLFCLKLDRGYLKEQFATAVLALLIPVLSLLMLHMSGAGKEELSVLLFPVGAALFLRIFFLDHIDPDYSNFLHPWFLSYQEMGGIQAIAKDITNYNLPYQYFLAIISYLPLPDLYMIKLFSVFFDYVLAWGAYRIVRTLDKDQVHIKAAVAFTILLFLPTILLNSSYWGQCDSIYSAFCIHAVSSALSGRNKESVALVALAFSFKLQAVFLFPFWGVMWISRKIRLKDIYIFMIVIILTLLPALLLKKPFPDILRVYLNQSCQYAALSLRAPSVFHFLPDSVVSSGNPVCAALGIILAGLSVLGLFSLAFHFRKRISSLSFLAFAGILSIAIPYLLPHMHERYFYLAECLTAILSVVYIKTIPAAVLVSYASLSSYLSYLRIQPGWSLSIHGIVYKMVPESCAMLLALISMYILLQKFLQDGLNGNYSQYYSN